MRPNALVLLLAGAALASPVLARPDGGPAPRTAARSDDDKVTCRYETVTGQLAGRVKRCLTGREWRARSRNARAESEKMINRGFSCSDEHCQ